MKEFFSKLLTKLLELAKKLVIFLFSMQKENVEIPEEEYKEPEPVIDPEEIEQEVTPEIKIEEDPFVEEEPVPETLIEEDENEEITPPKEEVKEEEEVVIPEPEVSEPVEELSDEEEIPDWVDPDVFKEAIEDDPPITDEEWNKDTGEMTEEDLFFTFVSNGANFFGAAGLMGNLYAESGLRSNNLQNTYSKQFGMSDEEYTEAVDNGTYTNFVGDKAGYGLAQWTYWTRKQNLLTYAVETNRSIGNCVMQCEFLIKELKESYKSVWNTLCNATSVLEASNAVLLKFEKPADQSEKAKVKRAGYGETYYKLYTVNTPNSTNLNMDLRKKVAKYAEKYVGVKEGSKIHKFIIDTYNSVTPLPRSYAVKYTDSWCATFISFVSIALGLTEIIPRECSCQKMIELFKKMNSWQETDSYVPNVGDIIFYDWQDDGKGDNTAWSDHVGIVELVNGDKIYVIEGNYSNSVKRRTLKVDGQYIRGFGTPNYGFSKASGEEVIDNPNFGESSYLAQTTSDLNLRSSASSANKLNIIGVIPKNRYVYVISDMAGSDWVKVQTILNDESYNGYVHKKYLSVVDISKNEKREVTAGGLNARADRSTSANKIFTMKKGDVFTVITHSTWGLILYKKNIAYANITDAYSKKV